MQNGANANLILIVDETMAVIKDFSTLMKIMTINISFMT
jgi:hypothetical protein